MLYRFRDKRLEAVAKGERRLQPHSLKPIFHRRLATIQAAKDVRDLGRLRSLRFEKLKGKRKGDGSIRLNKQYRLTFGIVKEHGDDVIEIIDIEDYH